MSSYHSLNLIDRSQLYSWPWENAKYLTVCFLSTNKENSEQCKVKCALWKIRYCTVRQETEQRPGSCPLLCSIFHGFFRLLLDVEDPYFFQIRFLQCNLLRRCGLKWWEQKQLIKRDELKLKWKKAILATWWRSDFVIDSLLRSLYISVQCTMRVWFKLCTNRKIRRGQPKWKVHYTLLKKQHTCGPWLVWAAAWHLASSSPTQAVASFILQNQHVLHSKECSCQPRHTSCSLLLKISKFAGSDFLNLPVLARLVFCTVTNAVKIGFTIKADFRCL